jgi:uncharacterized protein (DUF58 family)
MKVRQLAWILLGLAAALVGLGILVNSWFYTLGSSVVLLYVVWRYASFASIRSALRITVTRIADREAARLGSFVTFEVTVTSNKPVQGTYAEVLPKYAIVVEGQSSARLSLGPGLEQTLRYTVQLASRADLIIERVQFTLESDLFTETMSFKSTETVLKQPFGALGVEQGTRVGSVGGAMSTSSITDLLYRSRPVEMSMDTAYLREYGYRDHAKLIVWKTSARVGRLMMRVLLPELEDSRFGEGTPINLIVDQTSDMARGPLSQTNLELVANFAGRFVRLGAKKGSPISLVTYDEENITESGVGDSHAHETGIADKLDSAEFNSHRVRATDAATPSNWKPGITSAEVNKFRLSSAANADDATDDDVRRFREIVSYLYAHEEGYRESLEESTAFRAVARTINRGERRSIVVILSDLESNLDPLMEGIRLAAARGNAVHVIAFFPIEYETFEEAIINVNELYANYQKHRLRVNSVRQIKDVAVYEVMVSDLLETATVEDASFAQRLIAQ